MQNILDQASAGPGLDEPATLDVAVLSPAVAPGAPTPNEIAALSALYAAQRSDGATKTSLATALLGAAVVYLTATLASVGPIVNQLTWATALVPIPLWIIVTYHSLVTTAAMVRGLAVRALEHELLRATRFTEREGFVISSEAPEVIMNATEAGPANRAASYFSYGGIAALVASFTVYMVIRSPLNLSGLIAFTTVYAVIGAIALASWRGGLTVYQRSADLLGRGQPVTGRARRTRRAARTVGSPSRP